jgi:hypothetical protein
MGYTKEKNETMSARCTIVSASEEAKGNAELQRLATDIQKEIGAQKSSNLTINLKNEEYLSQKKVVKKLIAHTIDLATESQMMLESLKPIADANAHSITTKSEFKIMKISAVVDQATIIGNQLKDKSAQLLDRGYKQEQIDMLPQSTKELIAAIEKESAIKIELNLMRNNRTPLDTSINSKFKLLNTAVTINKGLMPTLYASYFAIKTTRNKNNHMTIEGCIVCDGKPVANANIKILSIETPKPKKSTAKSIKASLKAMATSVEKVIYDKFSNADGEFSTQKLKAGAYKCIITKNGHILQELTLYVNPKETTTIRVQLDKQEVSKN